jgi:hypothetical protein
MNTLVANNKMIILEDRLLINDILKTIIYDDYYIYNIHGLVFEKAGNHIWSVSTRNYPEPDGRTALIDIEKYKNYKSYNITRFMYFQLFIHNNKFLMVALIPFSILTYYSFRSIL